MSAAHPFTNSILSRCGPMIAGAGQRVTYQLGDVIQQPNQPTSHVHFPLDLMASFVRHLVDGSTIEVGIVGFEGAIGIDLLFGAVAQPNEITAQIAGTAIRFDASAAKAAFESDATFRGLVLVFANAFMIQIGQTAACNRLHALELRLARWLLMVNDRTGTPEIRLTQEFLSQMLGTRIAGVNEAVSALTNAGLLRHRRQWIEIVDREGLETATCECYELVRKQYERDRVMHVRNGFD